ncbi:MAG: hypothetical protein V1895_00750 [Parcubacteria group bacterium]
MELCLHEPSVHSNEKGDDILTQKPTRKKKPTSQEQMNAALRLARSEARLAGFFLRICAGQFVYGSLIKHELRLLKEHLAEVKQLRCPESLIAYTWRVVSVEDWFERSVLGQVCDALNYFEDAKGLHDQAEAIQDKRVRASFVTLGHDLIKSERLRTALHALLADITCSLTDEVVDASPVRGQ